MFSVISPPRRATPGNPTPANSTPGNVGPDSAREHPQPQSAKTELQRPRPDIGTLTALRFVAALWVVLFHLQAMQQTFLAPVYELFRPVIANGDLGVDVFFVLSGFIITYTYLDRLGPRFRWRAAG